MIDFFDIQRTLKLFKYLERKEQHSLIHPH
jgi:hypothetical protein